LDGPGPHRPQGDFLHFALAAFFVHAVDNLKTEVGDVEVSYNLLH